MTPNHWPYAADLFVTFRLFRLLRFLVNASLTFVHVSSPVYRPLITLLRSSLTNHEA